MSFGSRTERLDGCSSGRVSQTSRPPVDYNTPGIARDATTHPDHGWGRPSFEIVLRGRGTTASGEEDEFKEVLIRRRDEIFLELRSITLPATTSVGLDSLPDV